MISTGYRWPLYDGVAVLTRPILPGHQHAPNVTVPLYEQNCALIAGTVGTPTNGELFGSDRPGSHEIQATSRRDARRPCSAALSPLDIGRVSVSNRQGGSIGPLSAGSRQGKLSAKIMHLSFQ